MRDAYKIISEKSEEKRRLARCKRKWEDLPLLLLIILLQFKD
jgi:hypothetical protein